MTGERVGRIEKKRKQKEKEEEENNRKDKIRRENSELLMADISVLTIDV